MRGSLWVPWSCRGTQSSYFGGLVTWESIFIVPSTWVTTGIGFWVGMEVFLVGGCIWRVFTTSTLINICHTTYQPKKKLVGFLQVALHHWQRMCGGYCEKHWTIASSADITTTSCSTSQFLFEMQLKPYPIFKRTERGLDRAVISLCRQHGKSGKDAVTRKIDVNAKIRCNILYLLKAISEPADISEFEPPSPVVQISLVEAEFAPRSSCPPTFSRQDRRAEEELDRWLEGPVDIARHADFTPKESILEFWQSLEQQSDHSIIPKAVSVRFATPVSSCQIERDFGVSGQMVTTQRTTLAEHNIDM
ncbi:unnamed protein product [Phytophthora fragariaefolia]|uniref:Unnamed protein product n=1 Tax=Phytophthora fragariaefolia TaxID=1490495 RepID=A0A9W6Y6W1_9STRA|nr:unnamed protein product [Phytophthora fragariaefolia]